MYDEKTCVRNYFQVLRSSLECHSPDVLIGCTFRFNDVFHYAFSSHSSMEWVELIC